MYLFSFLWFWFLFFTVTVSSQDDASDSITVISVYNKDPLIEAEGKLFVPLIVRFRFPSNFSSTRLSNYLQNYVENLFKGQMEGKTISKQGRSLLNITDTTFKKLITTKSTRGITNIKSVHNSGSKGVPVHLPQSDNMVTTEIVMGIPVDPNLNSQWIQKSKVTDGEQRRTNSYLSMHTNKKDSSLTQSSQRPPTNLSSLRFATINGSDATHGVVVFSAPGLSWKIFAPGHKTLISQDVPDGNTTNKIYFSERQVQKMNNPNIGANEIKHAKRVKEELNDIAKTAENTTSLATLLGLNLIEPYDQNNEMNARKKLKTSDNFKVWQVPILRNNELTKKTNKFEPIHKKELTNQIAVIRKEKRNESISDRKVLKMDLNINTLETHSKGNRPREIPNHEKDEKVDKWAAFLENSGSQKDDNPQTLSTYISISDNQPSKINNVVSNRHNQPPKINNVVSNRHNKPLKINNVVSNRHNQPPKINNVVSNRHNQLPKINNVVSNRHNQPPKINNVVSNRHNQPPKINNVVSNRHNQLPKINNVVSNRHNQPSKINNVVTNRQNIPIRTESVGSMLKPPPVLPHIDQHSTNKMRMNLPDKKVVNNVNENLMDSNKSVWGSIEDEIKAIRANILQSSRTTKDITNQSNLIHPLIKSGDNTIDHKTSNLKRTRITQLPTTLNSQQIVKTLKHVPSIQSAKLENGKQMANYDNGRRFVIGPKTTTTEKENGRRITNKLISDAAIPHENDRRFLVRPENRITGKGTKRGRGNTIIHEGVEISKQKQLTIQEKVISLPARPESITVKNDSERKIIMKKKTSHNRKQLNQPVIELKDKGLTTGKDEMKMQQTTKTYDNGRPFVVRPTIVIRENDKTDITKIIIPENKKQPNRPPITMKDGELGNEGNDILRPTMNTNIQKQTTEYDNGKRFVVRPKIVAREREIQKKTPYNKNDNKSKQLINPKNVLNDNMEMNSIQTETLEKQTSTNMLDNGWQFVVGQKNIITEKDNERNIASTAQTFLPNASLQDTRRDFIRHDLDNKSKPSEKQSRIAHSLEKPPLVENVDTEKLIRPAENNKRVKLTTDSTIKVNKDIWEEPLTKSRQMSELQRRHKEQDTKVLKYKGDKNMAIRTKKRERIQNRLETKMLTQELGQSSEGKEFRSVYTNRKVTNNPSNEAFTEKPPKEPDKGTRNNYNVKRNMSLLEEVDEYLTAQPSITGTNKNKPYRKSPKSSHRKTEVTERQESRTVIKSPTRRTVHSSNFLNKKRRGMLSNIMMSSETDNHLRKSQLPNIDIPPPTTRIKNPLHRSISMKKKQEKKRIDPKVVSTTTENYTMYPKKSSLQENSETLSKFIKTSNDLKTKYKNNIFKTYHHRERTNKINTIPTQSTFSSNYDRATLSKRQNKMSEPRAASAQRTERKTDKLLPIIRPTNNYEDQHIYRTKPARTLPVSFVKPKIPKQNMKLSKYSEQHPVNVQQLPGHHFRLSQHSGNAEANANLRDDRDKIYDYQLQLKNTKPLIQLSSKHRVDVISLKQLKDESRFNDNSDDFINARNSNNKASMLTTSSHDRSSSLKDQGRKKNLHVISDLSEGYEYDYEYEFESDESTDLYQDSTEETTAVRQVPYFNNAMGKVHQRRQPLSTRFVVNKRERPIPANDKRSFNTGSDSESSYFGVRENIKASRPPNGLLKSNNHVIRQTTISDEITGSSDYYSEYSIEYVSSDDFSEIDYDDYMADDSPKRKVHLVQTKPSFQRTRPRGLFSNNNNRIKHTANVPFNEDYDTSGSYEYEYESVVDDYHDEGYEFYDESEDLIDNQQYYERFNNMFSRDRPLIIYAPRHSRVRFKIV